jgi:hypothetical protein
MVITCDKNAILCLHAQITPIYWLSGIIVFHGDASNSPSVPSNVSSERTCSVYSVFFFNKELVVQSLFSSLSASTPYFMQVGKMLFHLHAVK